ncbi:MAG: hypothetical protein Q7S22_04415 [Candidatus Micrarchaeota archaeon]|nr:hypothetical protein [Candidatus Micrarchaeota archaeon]
MKLHDHKPTIVAMRAAERHVPKEMRATPTMLEGPIVLEVKKGIRAIINDHPKLPAPLADCVSFSVQRGPLPLKIYGAIADGNIVPLTWNGSGTNVFVRVDPQQAEMYEKLMYDWARGSALVYSYKGGVFRSCYIPDGINFVRLLETQ